MSTAKERQAKRRANIMADSELHQAQVKKDKRAKENANVKLREKKCLNSN